MNLDGNLAEDLLSVVGTSRQYQFRIGCRPSPKLGTQQEDRGSSPVPRRAGCRWLCWRDFHPQVSKHKQTTVRIG